MKEVLTWTFAFIAAIAVFYLAGGAILLQENRAADAILRSDYNATPMIEPEFSQRQQPPALNQGKPPLPCAECAGYILTDWRDSPTVYGPNGLYKGEVRGDRFIWEKGHQPTMERLFSKTPQRGN